MNPVHSRNLCRMAHGRNQIMSLSRRNAASESEAAGRLRPANPNYCLMWTLAVVPPMAMPCMGLCFTAGQGQCPLRPQSGYGLIGNKTALALCKMKINFLLSRFLKNLNIRFIAHSFQIILRINKVISPLAVMAMVVLNLLFSASSFSRSLLQFMISSLFRWTVVSLISGKNCRANCTSSGLTGPIPAD